jgi:DNA polymerase-3 subunit delta
MTNQPSAGTEKPLLYLFYGNDEAAMQRLIQELEEKVLDGMMGEMNLTRFTENPSVDEVRSAAYVIPMFADRRLVVVNNAAAWISGQKNKESLIQMLEGMPASTGIAIQLTLEAERGKWKDFPPTHWLQKWINNQPGGRVYQKEFNLPGLGQMPGLIMKLASEKNGKFSLEAAQALTRAVGNDTLTAQQEIEKLLNYVNFEREVTAEDVILLTPDIAPVSIFDMVDSIGERNLNKAIQLLNRLLESEQPIPLFGMIIRQFRLLILAREVIDNGGRKAQIEKALSVHPFVAEKLEKQARYFSMEQLKDIYHRLLETDENMKTSRMEPGFAIEMFVAEIAQI